jgi:hypothetical protein
VRYLSCSLIAEGGSDLSFLSGLLRRQLEKLGTESGLFTLDQIIASPCRTIHSRERVLASLSEDLGCYDLVFAHNDHNERGKLDRLREGLSIPADSRLIDLIPVRETEAWMLADPSALLALGGGVDVGEIPNEPGGVERLPDPKAVLERVLGKRASDEVFEFIGLNISLERLAQVPAYKIFRDELTTALKELNFQ